MKNQLFKTVTLCVWIMAAGASSSLLAQTFTGQDLGTPTHPGGFTNNADGTISVAGGGSDIWNNSDSGFYYYASVSGLEWDARMRVLSFTGPDTWSKVELMVRRPATPGGAPAGGDEEMNVCMTQPPVSVPDGGTGENDVEWQWRGTSGGASANSAYSGSFDSYPNEYARIVRLGNVFNFYWSTDGVNWNLIGSQDTSTTANGFDGIPWENPILVGVAVTAHNDTSSQLGVAVITNLTVVPIGAPTAVGMTSPIKGTTTVYAYEEASFSFAATNNAIPLGDVPMTYTWYKNNQVANSNLLTTNYTFLTTAADNGAQIYAVASPLGYPSITVTSAVLTLTANPGAQIFTNGLKHELWANVTRTQVENGDCPLANILSRAVAADFNIEAINNGVNYAERLSGYFIPPTTDSYVFFINSDDTSDLYISTDNTAAHKYLIAQETAWSNPYDWLASDGGGVVGQKRSDQWSPDGGVTVPYASGIPLVAGQLYYIEAVHGQVGGGANLGVTYQTETQITNSNWSSVFTNGVPPLLEATNGNIALITFPGSTLTWTSQPKSATAFQGANATFSAAASSDSEMNVQYQWYINSAPFTNGGTGPTLSLANVPLSYNGAQIFVVASLPESSLSITSSPAATLTVQAAVWEPGFAKDERWNNSSRTAIESGSVGVPDYTMAVPSWAVNTANNDSVNNIGRRVTGYFVPPSTGRYVFFVNSDDDSDLFLSTDNTAGNKRIIAQEAGWSNPWDFESVGGGSTVTQKRSDQWSPDGGVTVPYATGIPLNGGQQYYLEQDYHQGGGGENLEATFKLTTDPDPLNGVAGTALQGNAIGINAIRCTYVAFTQQPTNFTAQAYAGATFTAAGVSDSQLPVGQSTGDEASYTNNFMFYQWYTNGVAVSGANAGSFVLGQVLPDQNGLQVSCQIRSLGYADTNLNRLWSNSLTATLTVVTGAPPTLVWESVVTNNYNTTLPYSTVVYADVAFSGPMNPAALTNANNYVFSAGSGITAADIIGITASPSYNSVELALDKTPSLPFTVTVSGMSAEGGGPLLTGPTVTNASTVELAPLDIGGAGTTLTGIDPAVPSTVYVNGPGAYTVQCEGSDIYNAADGFNFLYEPRSGSFDVVVRMVKTTHVSNWTKGGLMVREALDSASRNYSIVNDPDASDGIPALDGSGLGASTVECNARLDNGGTTGSWRQNAPSQPPTYPNAWVRLNLQRITNGVVVQDILTAYSSTNAINWEQLGQTDIATNGTTPAALADPAYIGICSTAHANDPTTGYTGQYLDTAVYANYNSHYVGLPVLSVSHSGSNLVISWTPTGGRLESSPALVGAGVNWQPVGSSNPATVPIGPSTMFFRVISP